MVLGDLSQALNFITASVVEYVNQFRSVLGS